MDGLTIVIGLGNPGQRYRATRHNVGFRVVERLAARRRARWSLDAVSRRYWSAGYGASQGRRVVLAKPRTYMNRCGRAAGALCGRFEAGPENLVAVYDDADLELGRVRVRREGGAGGHNGVRSLIDVLGTPRFGRVRLGVRGEGRERCDLASYVLGPFEEEEERPVLEMVQRAADAVEAIVDEGFDRAMNRFNARDAGGPAGASD